MIQRVVQVLLLITLVGQNFLSPALATHDIMHSLKSIAAETVAISLGASSDPLDISTPLNQGPVNSKSLNVNLVDSNQLELKSVNQSGLSLSLADLSAFNCADACTMLASGHCVSHCVSLTGIFIEPSLTKYRSGKSPQNSFLLWSSQTADSLSIHRPPIV